MADESRIPSVQERARIIQEFLAVVDQRAKQLGKRWGVQTTPQGKRLILPMDPEIEQAYRTAFQRFWPDSASDQLRLAQSGSQFPQVIWQGGIVKEV